MADIDTMTWDEFTMKFKEERVSLMKIECMILESSLDAQQRMREQVEVMASLTTKRFKTVDSRSCCLGSHDCWWQIWGKCKRVLVMHLHLGV